MNEYPESRFSNREEIEQIGNLRRFNIPALLSLILGLCSAVALLAPNMWVVPILAVFLGIFGLVMAIRGDNMGGKVPAWIGIFLALFFISWAASKIYFHRQVIYSEAEVIARQWLNLVIAGDDLVAHQAMMHPTARQPSGANLAEYYAKDEQATEQKDSIFTQPPIDELLGIGEASEISLVENITQDIEVIDATVIRQVYRITPPDGEPVEAIVTVTRSHKEAVDRASWIIAEAEPVD